MPARHAAPGAPCWIDLQTSDVPRSREFYTRLLGWHAEEQSPEFGGYFMFTKDGVPVAGGMAADAQAPVSDVWSVYLETDDAGRTLDAVTAAGGQVIVPAMQVADLGTMGFVVDPGGAGIGLWQPAGFPGLAAVGEPGTPGWFELHTRDYERSLEFYRAVFGWETKVSSDVPELRYSMAWSPATGTEHAGVMDATAVLPEGAAAAWSIYFAVDDTDAALAATTELGGAVVRPGEDTPYGRLAVATDATGATFKLGGPNSGTGA